MKKTQRMEVNLLDLVPQRKVDFTVDEDGRVILVIPRFKREWLRRLFVPKRKAPNVNVTLDQFGSRVWRQCDGATSVGRIAEQLREEFGEAVDPAHERVAVFMKQLLGHGFITLDAPALPSSGSGGQE